MGANVQTYDGLTVSVRKSPDSSRYDYGVWLYGTFFVLGGFPAAGFEGDLTEAAERMGQTVVFPEPSPMQ